MSADTDRFDARLSNVEGQLEHINERLGEANNRVDRLDDRMGDRFDSMEKQIARNRTEMRREMLVIAGIVTAILAGLQLYVALGGL